MHLKVTKYQKAFSFSTLFKKMHKISVLQLFYPMGKVDGNFFEQETKMKILSEF